jgi:hypothetical protein
LKVLCARLVRRSVNLISGDNSLSADVPALHTLTVRCSTNANARQLTLDFAGKQVATCDDEKTVTDTVVEFLLLKGGEYEL